MGYWPEMYINARCNQVSEKPEVLITPSTCRPPGSLRIAEEHEPDAGFPRCE
jgi:hypothetical protein